MSEALAEILKADETAFKAIKNEDEFKQNLEDNCIPDGITAMTADDYKSFLEVRREKMTDLIRKYYYSL